MPRCGHTSHIVKMHYFFKLLPLYSQARIRQTKYIVMMTKEGSTKIMNFLTTLAGVLVLRRDHTMKMQYFFKNFLLYTQT